MAMAAAGTQAVHTHQAVQAILAVAAWAVDQVVVVLVAAWAEVWAGAHTALVAVHRAALAVKPRVGALARQLKVAA